MNDAILRKHVLYLLDGGGAHLDFNKAVAGLPVELLGAKATGIPYSPWHLVEHMRICQWDILEFCTKPDHVSPQFPDGYWPDGDAPSTRLAWEESLSRFRDDLEAMRQLVGAESTDLLASIPHGDGQTILREALLVADHNAYHLGQLVVVRRALQAWPED
jgi:hypothetical protein